MPFGHQLPCRRVVGIGHDKFTHRACVCEACGDSHTKLATNAQRATPDTVGQGAVPVAKRLAMCNFPVELSGFLQRA